MGYPQVGYPQGYNDPTTRNNPDYYYNNSTPKIGKPTMDLVSTNRKVTNQRTSMLLAVYIQ